jgi:predicted metal-dependent peptidase
VNTFAGTLLHEMLHAWVNMLERKGFQTDEEREEKFIRRAEKIVIRQFGKQFHKGR